MSKDPPRTFEHPNKLVDVQKKTPEKPTNMDPQFRNFAGRWSDVLNLYLKCL